MNLLAIESATNLVGAAVISSGGSASERSHQGGRMHAELLAPAIEEACGLEGLTVQDIDAIAVDIGPGLFTGLRVGVSTAKALAQGLGLGVLGVSSLDILAAEARQRAGTKEAATVVVVVDARRGEVFTARYGCHHQVAETSQMVDPALARLSPSELVTPEGLVEALLAADSQTGERMLFVGDGAVRYRQLLLALPGADLDLAESLSSPSPVALARLALTRIDSGVELARPVDLVPDYRREADARINWVQRTPPAGPTRP